MDHHISYSLPVTIFREGESFVAYTPALDLSSTGSTEEVAKKMFAESVETFFEELIEMGTLDCVLQDLGWTKEKGKYQPPEVVRQSVINVVVPLPA
jgi:hypothetical protein